MRRKCRFTLQVRITVLLRAKSGPLGEETKTGEPECGWARHLILDAQRIARSQLGKTRVVVEHLYKPPHKTLMAWQGFVKGMGVRPRYGQLDFHVGMEDEFKR